ncbi:MAG: hypothetical protein AB8B55_23475 [Mariniblastus sp.]
MLKRILTAVTLSTVVFAVGCVEPMAESKSEKKPILNQTTQDIGEYDADGDGEGAKLADTQVKSNNPYGAAMQGYGFAAGQVSKLAIEKNIQLFHATTGRYPKDHEEFMTEIIKKYNLKLPQLPKSRKYQYDVEKHELVIVEAGDAK